VGDAADQAKHVVQDAVVSAALVSCAAVAAVAAIAIGLVALARWVADYYGPFTALGVVGGILVLATVILVAVAVGRQRLSRRAGSGAKVPQSVVGRSATDIGAASSVDAAQAEMTASPAAAVAHRGSRFSASDFGKLIGMARRNPIAVIAGAISRPNRCCISAGMRGLGMKRSAPNKITVNSGIVCHLVLNLGFELSAEQDHDGGNPHPHHHTNAGAKRAVSGVVVGKACKIAGQ
jgi:hypothetical protein